MKHLALLALTVVSMACQAKYCHVSDSRYMSFRIFSHSDSSLKLDVEPPKHGQYDPVQRFIIIKPHSHTYSNLCSSSGAGLSSDVGLYRMPSRHYLEKWDVDMPQTGTGTIQYTKNYGMSGEV